jgi:hypothetical protein
MTIRIASRSIDLRSEPLRLDAIDGRGDCDLLWLVCGSLNWLEIFRFSSWRSSLTTTDVRGEWDLWWLLVDVMVVTSSLLLLSCDISEHDRRDDLLTLMLAVEEWMIVSAEKRKETVKQWN